MTFNWIDVLAGMAVALLLGLSFGYHWGKHAMLHLLSIHWQRGMPLDLAIRYERAMLKGQRPPE